jgi:hypothetical protein
MSFTRVIAGRFCQLPTQQQSWNSATLGLGLSTFCNTAVNEMQTTVAAQTRDCLAPVVNGATPKFSMAAPNDKLNNNLMQDDE